MSIQAAKYDTQKATKTCRVILFRCVPRFLPCVNNLPHNKNIVCGLKKFAAKSRVRVYFEQQILALLLVFHQSHNLSPERFPDFARISYFAHARGGESLVAGSLGLTPLYSALLSPASLFRSRY